MDVRNFENLQKSQDLGTFLSARGLRGSVRYLRVFTDFTETFELLKNFMSKCYTLGNFDGSTTLLAYIS